jgi:hypothetical protein
MPVIYSYFQEQLYALLKVSPLLQAHTTAVLCMPATGAGVAHEV